MMCILHIGIMRKAIRKEVSAGGRFDVFLGSEQEPLPTQSSKITNANEACIFVLSYSVDYSN